jgi:ubiquinone biosynthesis protein Coq4
VTLLVSVTSLSLEQRILSKTKTNALVKSVMATIDPINVSTHPQQQTLTLRQGLERYYQANPDFVRNQDLWVGIMRIPWCDMQRHDIMHVVTGYSTALEQELQLIGFLLTALTWKRPWYYYAQSFVVFLELLWQSIQGKAWGGIYHNPVQVCQLYLKGVKQGLTLPKKINAAIDPETVLDRDLASLRSEYGIQNAGAWD